MVSTGLGIGPDWFIQFQQESCFFMANLLHKATPAPKDLTETMWEASIFVALGRYRLGIGLLLAGGIPKAPLPQPSPRKERQKRSVAAGS